MVISFARVISLNLRGAISWHDSVGLGCRRGGGDSAEWNFYFLFANPNDSHTMIKINAPHITQSPAGGNPDKMDPKKEQGGCEGEGEG